MFSRSKGRPDRVPIEHDDDWIEVKRPPRDWKKVFLVIGLGTLSWVATYVGMLELIQANMGQLDFVTKVVIGFSVAMLMTMIVWLLDQMFAPHPFGIKFAYVVGYLFLTLISVGFGFGFYWKVLESRTEASRSAESAVAQVQAALVAGAARLDQLQGTLDQLTKVSREKAVVERESGASCPNSRPGDGPRRRLRDADAQRFSFASEFVKGRSAKVKGAMQGLEGDLKKIVDAAPSTIDAATGTRNKFLQALSRKLELTATNFNAFRTDPQLRQIRSELAGRANQSTFPTGRGNGTFSCPDPQLQSALFGVVKAIDQLPEMNKPEIATVEGAQAVVEAFRRLSATLQGALVLKLPPSADEIRELQTQAVRSVDPGRAQFRSNSGSGLAQGGLSQRDYIPLAIALFVDLCLLLVSIGRPMNRLGGLVPKMRDAERGPVYQILSKFDDIHRDQKIREKFEVFRHVVFDFHGDYYVAVPLDSPRNRNPDEVANLQLEAHLLANLFASFEKEKIFSRVYNPLLSRKTIQKKLWRQGSKFAGSQAFRVYRFRDGAWSDIILGAVMGAARRAKIERVRREQDVGPQLDVPATAAEADRGHDAVAAAELPEAVVKQRGADILADALGETVGPSAGARDDQGAAEGDEDALRTRQVAEQFKPFAADDIDPDMPEILRPKRPKKRSWPYHKPPAEPGEAHVELLPANSNTFDCAGEHAGNEVVADDAVMVTGTADDDHDPDAAGRDNVIVMPIAPSGGRGDGSDGSGPRYVPGTGTASSAVRPMDGGMGDVLAQAIQMPAPDMSPEPEDWMKVDALCEAAVDVAEVHECEMPPRLVTPTPSAETVTGELVGQDEAVDDEVEARMSVRITQRTADFEIPLSAMSNGQPIAFMKRGTKVTFNEPAAELFSRGHGDGQLRLDFANRGGPEVTAPHGEADTAAPGVIQLDALEAEGEDYSDDAAIFDGRDDLPSEADLVEISKRFAPQRRAE